MGHRKGEAKMAALDRIGWRQRAEASCSVRSLEQEEEEKFFILKLIAPLFNNSNLIFKK